MIKPGPDLPEDGVSPEPGESRPKPFEPWQDIAARIRSGLKPPSDGEQAPTDPRIPEPDSGDETSG